MLRFTRVAPLFAVLTCSLLVLATVLRVYASRPTAPAQATAMVTIQNFAFSPATLTVAPGTTVIWTNSDSVAHTVTSDTGAWAASAPLATGQRFSFTFAKPGTYQYHCSIHPMMKARVIVSAGTMRGGSMGGMMSTMGPMRKAPLSAFTGWYDNHTVLFLATDTSNQAEAMSEHINFSADLAKSLSSAETIYMVTNGAFANRGAVFSSEPGESDYTPLWQEVMVAWKVPSQAVALGSDNQIKGLAKAGKVTLQMTRIVLNCPIIKVAAHGANS